MNHPIDNAPPSVLKHLRQVLLEDFPLDAITRYLEEDWQPGFTGEDILAWAVSEGLREGKPGIAGIQQAVPEVKSPSAANASDLQLSTPNPQLSSNVPGKEEIPASAPPEGPPSDISVHPSSSVGNSVPSSSGPQPSPLNDQPRRIDCRRTGIVAKLPADLRDQVSQMIHDGLLYKTIVGRLKELGHPQVNRFHLRSWRKGGYQDWLKARTKMEEVKVLGQAVAQTAENGQLPETILGFATARAMDALQQLGPNDWRDLLESKSEVACQLINSLVAISKQANVLRKARTDSAAGSQKEPINGENLNIIRKRLGLI